MTPLFLPPLTAADNHFYLFGTDALGRDLFTHLLSGTLNSVVVAIIASSIASTIGLFLGLTAALSNKKVDTYIMRSVELKLCIPTLLVALLFHISFGNTLITLAIAMGISGWAYIARITRTLAVTEIQKNYIFAAQLIGQSFSNILFLHLLPNCIHRLLPTLTYRFGYLLLLESSLSFMGLGLPKTQPSLGLIVNEGLEYVHTDYYWIFLIPSLCLTLILFSIHTIGDYFAKIR